MRAHPARRHWRVATFPNANYLPPDDWFPIITSMFPPGLT